jgi:Ca-activated chloride channel family protein
MRSVRLKLLVAASISCASLASATALAGSAWSDLWRTPDQQGQALLDAGEPALAAARFQDPRRRAFADLEAGDDQEAAKLLQPFDDAESEYNRGNALARSGQLQAALAAYDAALKQAPADKDIRHNRDLVERALRQQRPAPQSSPGNGKQGGRGSGSAGQGQQAGQSAGRQQGRRASPQPGAGTQSGDRGSQTGDHGSSSPAGGQLASNGSAHSDGTESGAAQSAAGHDSGNTKEPAGQARSDAAEAAALARQQQRQQQDQVASTTQSAGSNRNGSPEWARTGARKDAQQRAAGGSQTPKQKPETERQLALDQWLRQIPDSPAGLLQRKFLIEHMLKQQQESGDQQEDGQ